MASESKLNPQVRTATIGVRTLRKIKIYPLSVGDQLNLSDLVIESLNKYNEITSDEKKSDMQVLSEVVDFVMSLINENLDQILDKVTDREQDETEVHLLDDITNEQALAIGKLIYEINFESLVKNVKSLFGEPQTPTEQLLKRQSPQSVKSTEATGLKTSSVKGTKKVGSRIKK